MLLREEAHELRILNEKALWVTKELLPGRGFGFYNEWLWDRNTNHFSINVYDCQSMSGPSLTRHSFLIVMLKCCLLKPARRKTSYQAAKTAHGTRNVA